MKRYYLLMLVCLSFITHGKAQTLQGEGTEDSPYLISNADELNSLRNYLGADYLNTYFRLTADIDLTDWIDNHEDEDIRTKGWKPIGGAYHNKVPQIFCGNFQGGGHIISGIWMDRTSGWTNWGLFSNVGGSTIDSLGVIVAKGKKIKCGGGASNGGVGGIAGAYYISPTHPNGGIHACFFKGDIENTIPQGTNWITTTKTGGIVGFAGGINNTLVNISYCYTEGSVTGESGVGGIVGSTGTGSTVSITNCINRSKVTGTKYLKDAGTAGGILGHMTSGGRVNIKNCIALNDSISSGENENALIGRIFAYKGSGTYNMAKNYALDSTYVNGATLKGEDDTDKNGVDKSLDALLSKSLYVEDGWELGSSWDIIAHLLKGSEDYPYLIRTAEDLNNLRNFTGSAYRGKHFRITDDIDLTDWLAANKPERGWVPIGSNFMTPEKSTDCFEGLLHGGGYVISSIWMRMAGASSVGGLFGHLKHATIDSLGVVGQAGKLIQANGDITSCGGIAGVADSTLITDCFVNADILGRYSAGGIVAISQESIIRRCYAAGSVRGYQLVGGVVGMSWKNIPRSVVEDCISANVVYGTSETNGAVGGIIGHITGGDTIRRNVALNPFIQGRTRASNGTCRVIGSEVTFIGPNVRMNNFALADMAANGQVVNDTKRPKSSLNGLGIDRELLKTKDFYKDSLEWILEDSKILSIIEGSTYPYPVRLSAPVALEQQPTITISATELSGTVEGDISKVWVRKDFNSPEEAIISENIWKYQLTDPKIGEVYTVWIESGEHYPGTAVHSYVTFGSGNGTEESPWEISTAGELNAVRLYMNSHYKLANDIDLTEWIENNSAEKGWVPLVNGNCYFEGTFDGNGKTISGIWTDGSAERNGLFSYIETTGVFKNTAVIADKNKAIKGSSYVAVIAGISKGKVENCFVSGTVIGSSSVGGITGGGHNGEIRNCYSLCDVKSAGAAGGIVPGSRAGKIENCYFAGTVEGRAKVGGIAGYGNDDIANCVSVASSLKAEDEVGRIVGIFSDYDGKEDRTATNLAYKGILINDDVDFVSKETAVDGTPVSMNELYDKETYQNLGWNFNDIWSISKAGLPYLKWMKSIDLQESTLSMQLGTAKPLGVKFVNFPEGDEPQVIYEVLSSGEAIVLDKEGNITAIAMGADTVRVTLPQTGYFVDCIINVNNIGIDDETTPRISVYPNPFAGYIVVKALADTKADITDISGKKVMEMELKEGENLIDTEPIPAGTYLLKTGAKTVKIVK